MPLRGRRLLICPCQGGRGAKSSDILNFDEMPSRLNDALEDAFRRCYHGFRPINDEGTTAVAA